MPDQPDQSGRKPRREPVRISVWREAWAVLGWATDRAVTWTKRVVRAWSYRLCAAVLLVLAVAGLLGMVLGPLLMAATGAR